MILFEFSKIIAVLIISSPLPCEIQIERLEREVIQKEAELSVMIGLHAGESTQKIINAIFGGIGSIITLIAGILTGNRMARRNPNLPRPDT